MLKKLLRLLKLLIIAALWTWIYVLSADWLMIKAWNFNFLSANDWRTINIFWQNGGIIKESKDYLFLGTLLLIVPLWYWVLRLLCRINWLNLLLAPFIWYNNYIIRKYGADSKRIILKNLGKSRPVKEELAAMMPKAKSREEMNLEAEQIRSSLQEKLQKRKEK